MDKDSLSKGVQNANARVEYVCACTRRGQLRRAHGHRVCVGASRFHMTRAEVSPWSPPFCTSRDVCARTVAVLFLEAATNVRSVVDLLFTSHVSLKCYTY